MKYRGVVYDVGLNFNDDGKLSVEPFDPKLVEYDMGVIANELHANAVRIEGEDISRLVTSTKLAHSIGLTVFFNPWKMHSNIEETLTFMREAAQAAEQLRREGIDTIFAASCEYTIFNKGVFPGETFQERLTWMMAQFGPDPSIAHELPQSLRDTSVKLNEALRSFVEVVRAEFKGQITYSSGPWEKVDWTMFDIVGIDYYRHAETDRQYVQGLDRYRFGKPVAVLEFGCCAYEGAAARGGAGFMLLKGRNPDGSGIFEDNDVPIRREREQAEYVGVQLDLLKNANVHAAFVYVFSFPCYPVGEGAMDMDMMSYSMVKTWPESDKRRKAIPPWEKKEVFYSVAGCYRELAAHSD